ncbi:ribonuclease HII [Corynebacterium aurimucosum]
MPDRILPGLERLDDSKKLTPAAREKLEPVIKRRALAWSVVHIGAKDIDAFGIQHANLSGMRRAVAQLGIRPGYVLSDALFVPGLPTPQLPIIAGDTAARCIAAASVLAKVSRDRLMVDVAKHYPGYALETHKGYGTAVHQDAIAQLGATPEHRMSYRNVAEAHARFLARA